MCVEKGTAVEFIGHRYLFCIAHWCVCNLWLLSVFGCNWTMIWANYTFEEIISTCPTQEVMPNSSAMCIIQWACLILCILDLLQRFFTNTQIHLRPLSHVWLSHLYLWPFAMSARVPTPIEFPMHARTYSYTYRTPLSDAMPCWFQYAKTTTPLRSPSACWAMWSW